MRSAISTAVEAARTSDPDWRTRHCAEPVADEAIRAGRDIWAETGGCPRSWREAAAFYRRLGVRTLEGAMTRLFGPPVDIRQARRGDAVMVRGALGVCRGEVIECMGATVPIGEGEMAWPIVRQAQNGPVQRTAPPKPLP